MTIIQQVLHISHSLWLKQQIKFFEEERTTGRFISLHLHFET